MRLAYTIALVLALPFLIARLWWRGRREPAYREGLLERFGIYKTDRPERLVWLHAVSVGEARAAEPLVRGLERALQGHAILITCTTAAGRETLKQVYGESVLAAYLPYDYPRAVQRFIEHFRPRLGVLMETEVWPNLLAGCQRHQMPVMLANARLSERSARGYERWNALARPAFEALREVCAQSPEDAERLRRVGAPAVAVTGNLKFDVTPDARQMQAGRQWREALGRPVILLASTRESEERAFIEVWKPQVDALLVVVPRHARRFDEVAQWAQSRRSVAPQPSGDDRVHLGDTMGEMAFYYSACDVAIIGGSFAPLGGQNLIEALAAGAPVILGPHMFNFAEATRLALQAGAALQCEDAAAALRAAMALLRDERRRGQMREAGQQLCARHRGATERHLAVCRRLLGL